MAKRTEALPWRCTDGLDAVGGVALATGGALWLDWKHSRDRAARRNSEQGGWAGSSGGFLGWRLMQALGLTPPALFPASRG